MGVAPLLAVLTAAAVVAVASGSRLFAAYGTTQQLVEVSSADTTAVTRFDPLLSGPLRHLVSVVHEPTSLDLSPANYSVFFSTLDSSIYRLYYPGAMPGTVQLTKVSDLLMAGGPSFVIDSFVVNLNIGMIYALDVSAMRIRIISIEDGRWMGDLATLPQGTGAYITCSGKRGVIYGNTGSSAP